MKQLVARTECTDVIHPINNSILATSLPRVTSTH
jgi:hypothetical protein